MNLSPFAEELMKIAMISRKDVREGTPITNRFSEVKKILQPGDIIVTKPSAENSTSLGLAAKLVSRLYGSQNDWVHSGLYDDNKRQVHTQYAFDHKKKKWLTDPDTLKVRSQSINVLPTNSDVLIVRPKVSDDDKQKALRNMKKLKGTGYSMGDVIRAGILPAKKSEGDKKVPKALMCHGSTAWSYQHALEFRPGKSPRHTLPHHIVESPDVEHVIAFSKDKAKR